MEHILSNLNIKHTIGHYKLSIEINAKEYNTANLLQKIMPYIEIVDLDVINGSLEDALKIFYNYSEVI